jgi:hypothetical protein
MLTFSMDLTNFSESFTGAVYDLNGSWQADLTAYKAATKLTPDSAVVPGQYVLSVPGDHTATSNHPGGDSYATYSINSAGAVTIGGSLADNTPFTQSTTVSTNGIWPLYAPLYKTKGKYLGIILGWQTNGLPTNYSGFVEWFKPTNAGAYYTNGFEWIYDTTPTNYTAPKAGTHYQIVFDGGTLTEPLTNSLTVTAAGQFTADAGQTNNLDVKVKLTPATGAITGQFLDPPGETLQFHGAFVSPESGGSGYILDSDDETGYFEMSLVP